MSSTTDSDWIPEEEDDEDVSSSNTVSYVSDDMVEEMAQEIVDNLTHGHQNLQLHVKAKYYDPMYTFRLGDELLHHGILPSPGSISKDETIRIFHRYQAQSMLLRMCSHPMFDVSFVVQTSYLPWGASMISLCVQTLQDIRYLKKHVPKLLFFGRGGLSTNQNLDFSWVEAFPDEAWCLHAFDGLSASPNFGSDWSDRLQKLKNMGYFPGVNGFNYGNFGVSRWSKKMNLQMSLI